MSRTELQFTCADCAERIMMNPPMRDALLAAGCPVCGATVAREVFAA